MVGFGRIVGALAGVVVVAGAVMCVPRALARGGTDSRSVRFDVVVTNFAGDCVRDLQEKDFTILDDDRVQAITSFRVGLSGPGVMKDPRVVYASFASAEPFLGCVVDGGIFRYEITFDVPNDARRNEYRRVEVKVDRPKLRIGTRQGYYVRF
jgi:hypothetical protein